MVGEWGRGRVYQRGNRWWIAFYVRGDEIRESGGKTEAAAKKRLRNRQKDVHAGRYVGADEEKLTVDQLLDGLMSHLALKGAKSAASYKSHLTPVREFFALRRAVDVTPMDANEFAESVLEAGKARATVNRSLGALRQAFNLARKQGRLARIPYIGLLKEDNARQGFFERADFEAVVAHLPSPLDDFARFGYLTGWRRGEIAGLTWQTVDRAAKEVRLATSKNGCGRVLPLEGELWDLMERRWNARHVAVSEGVTKIAEYVFHRTGKRIAEFRKPWAAACKAAKVPGRLFHDLRRTAARNMVRAGVSQSVAMSITGHKTQAMFLRYNITSEEDKRKALHSTQQYVGQQPKERTVTPMPARTGTD